MITIPSSKGMSLGTPEAVLLTDLMPTGGRSLLPLLILKAPRPCGSCGFFGYLTKLARDPYEQATGCLLAAGGPALGRLAGHSNGLKNLGEKCETPYQ